MEIKNEYKKSTFAGKYIKTSTIKKYLPKIQSYINEPASFVEIEASNKSDIKAIGNLTKYWPESYATDIYYTAKALRSKSLDRDKHKLYILTTQSNDFKNLNEKNILGIIHLINNNNEINILRLQSDPAIINSIERRVKHIGSSILDCIKNIFQKPIILNSRSSIPVRLFYKKNGFKLIDQSTLKYRWEPKRTDKIEE